MIEKDRHYRRNLAATAITTRDGAVFVMPGTAAHRAAGIDTAAVAELWESLASPATGEELAARIASAPAGVSALVESLIAAAFVLRGSPGEFVAEPPPPPAPGTRPCAHLVIGVTGAVQAVFTPHLVRRLAQEFADTIDVVLTRSAQEFLVPRAISVFGAGVWCDPFEEKPGVPAPHAHLAQAARMILVLPATADALFRLAHGAASDLLGLVVCATEAPVVVVPSMHPVMWRHSAVRRNVETLRRDGVYVIEPGPAASVGDAAGFQPGGAGLGAGSVNLVGALTAILELSRPRSPRP